MGWWYRSPPLKGVKGGIKAQINNKSSQNWWAKRWNQTLEAYDIGERLSRGKTYARKGQVASIKIQKGSVTATVQGSWRYKVQIKVNTLNLTQQQTVARGIFSRPVITASLLAGQMPEDIEDVFDEMQMRLFPDVTDIETSCTCPDWSNPCKHIAAVYLILGEEFDRDPFMIFLLRGMTRNELLKIAGIGETKPTFSKTVAPKKRREKKLPLADPASFWGSLDVQKTDKEGAIIPVVPATLVKQLGKFPFWRGEDAFIPSMEKMYHDASQRAMKTFLGESE